MDFAAKCRMQAGIHVLTISGELDIAVAEKTRDLLGKCLADTRTACVIDLSELTFCDSIGLSLMIGAKRKASALGLVIPVDRRNLHQLLKITGLDSVFAVYGSLEDAIRAIRTI